MTLEEGASALGLRLSCEQVARLRHHLDLLIAWNRRADLVAPAPPHRITEHFLDSLLLLAMARPAVSWRVADIGSGAGFPGLVWAIVRPDLWVTLIEPRRKRVAFLERVLLETATHNATAVARRAEQLRADPEHARAYDLAVARAVASRDVVVRLAAPLVRPGGTIFVSVGPRDGIREGEVVEMRVPWAADRLRRAASVRLP